MFTKYNCLWTWILGSAILMVAFLKKLLKSPVPPGVREIEPSASLEKVNVNPLLCVGSALTSSSYSANHSFISSRSKTLLNFHVPISLSGVCTPRTAMETECLSPGMNLESSLVFTVRTAFSSPEKVSETLNLRLLCCLPL